MYPLYIPKDGELCPEWRIIVCINFPGENNYFKIIISLDDIERISKSIGWTQIDNYHFNKDKCESFMFYTEYKDTLGKWVPYDEEGWNNVLKHELNCELAAKQTMAHKLGDTDPIVDTTTLGQFSLAEAMKMLGMDEKQMRIPRGV